LLIPLRKLLRLEDIITMRHIDVMCKVTLATGSIVGYAYGMEVFIAWYSGNPAERFLFLQNRAADPFIFGPLFNVKPAPYWWAYWSMITCNVIVPQLFWFKRIRHSILVVFVLSILVNIGMWFERFVIVVTSLHRDFLPSNWDYFKPTWVDICTYLGTFGLFFTMFLLFIRFLPLVAIAEVKGVTPQADPHHPMGGAKPGGHH
jgi:Ni/Fe-hydrogenase subunit HybB-like protein